MCPTARFPLHNQIKISHHKQYLSNPSTDVTGEHMALLTGEKDATKMLRSNGN